MLRSRRPTAPWPIIHRKNKNDNGEQSRANELDETDESPLRAELFSGEQLANHATVVASWHELATRKGGPDYLLPRLADNERVLVQAQQLITDAVRAKSRIAPADEWLLDNFYLIEEQIRTARQHLPRGYSRELPRLATGPKAGYPRVYDMALELISHVDGRIDGESLSGFVAAYQSIHPLKLGELWAIPIMLRLALIENLRRVAARVARDRVARNRAEQFAELVLKTADSDPNQMVLVLADMAREMPCISCAFAAELARRLQGYHTSLALPRTWLEQCLSEMHLTADQLVQQENQQQAADQISMGNSIGSLRFLGAHNWRDFIESQSIVEQTLRADPLGVYEQMDFATRDHYRHAVERIARSSPLSENEVAQHAIDLAGAAAVTNEVHDRQRHVGYYLVDRGRMQLEQRCQMQRRGLRRLQHFARRHSQLIYFSAVALLTIGVMAAMLWMASGISPWLLAAMLPATAFAGSYLAVAIVNWLSTLLVPPSRIARLDFSNGITKDARTLVVVPTLLGSTENADELLDALEVRFLANRDGNLHFALLTDFPDAAAESLPEDADQLAHLLSGIIELNRRYPAPVDQPASFYLFHRPRQWNAQERTWMAHERKRGKLKALNAALRSGDSSSFTMVAGELQPLQEVRYVITLDTDTKLPRDTARQLTAAMAHPLNRPRIDPKTRRVVEGYGILQPRIAVSLPSSRKSWFVRVFGGAAGLDPYTRAVSDVYQDVFQEGSFVGKGIYDVDAFHAALQGRFPDNLILSHDLIEGCYARSGLISDLELYEDFPSRYLVDIHRRRRWTRGDWQILPWLLPRVPQTDRSWVANPLSFVSRWKIFDNLRRSLVPAGFFTLYLLGWLALPNPAWWTLLVTLVVLLPALLMAAAELLRKQEEMPLDMHLRGALIAGWEHLIQALLPLIWLPFEAWFNLESTARALTRAWITRKHLLQWTTASDSARTTAGDLAATVRSMWASPLFAVAAAAWLAVERPVALVAAAPVLALWVVGPVLAWWLSRPIMVPPARLSRQQIHFLRRIARKTWRFFETFVQAEENWLPPDNFQEYPAAVIAHRTSPTNIGMALTANLAAYDLGYISVGRLMERTAGTLNTMERLERFRSHFLNWYDTRTLEPLLPRYVSAVDSGNLSAHLLVLRSGFEELTEAPLVAPTLFAGLTDSLELLFEAVASQSQSLDATASASLQRLKSLQTQLETQPAGLAEVYQRLLQLGEVSKELSSHALPLEMLEPSWWIQSFHQQCQDQLDDLQYLAPWLSLPEEQLKLAAVADETSRTSAATNGSHRALLERWDRTATLQQIIKWGEAPPAGASAELIAALQIAAHNAADRAQRLTMLAAQCEELAQVDYTFLYDTTRDLLTIGYNVTEHRRDTSCYDLLASEARVASYLAIALGQLPQKHWFALGRLLTTTDGQPMLLSWSGSMFEYLMPLLVMPTYEDTVLDETCRAVVQRQIDYGRQKGVPWGMSESGYHAVDAALNYQYRAFGVPGTGLRRGLSEDMVVAPYATVLALMVAPEAAHENLQRLSAGGVEGAYGFYEAIDFTTSRIPRRESFALVRSFMAHHQGMSLLALDYLLLNKPMQRRFERDLALRAADLLLQERVPKAAPFYPHVSEADGSLESREMHEPLMRVFSALDTPIPEVHLLSNSSYQVMVTSGGGGYSRWKGLALTRWREDATRDNWGTFCYLRDVGKGDVWSLGRLPTLSTPRDYEAIFLRARAEFRRRDLDYDTHTEIAVSPEDDIEVRRVSITNRSRSARMLDITTYAEVVLAPQAADVAHPSFSNLFVQTELHPGRKAILCTRRPRSAHEPEVWMVHLLAIHGSAAVGEASYETDRARFVGRGRSTMEPLAMDEGEQLSGSVGSVLDPIVAIRQTIKIEADQTVTFHFVNGAAESRDAALALIEKYHDHRLADRVFDLSWTHSQVVLKQLNASEAEAQLYGRLASSVIYANGRHRAPPGLVAQNHRGQSALWSFGISGDLPIVLLRIGDPNMIDLARQMIQAHAYWRKQGLAVEMMIWNEDHSGYRQPLHDAIMSLIAQISPQALETPGGIFVRRADQLSEEDRVLIQAVARVVIDDRNGTLAEQIDGRRRKEILAPLLAVSQPRRGDVPAVVKFPSEKLLYDNGHGGFSGDGREYVITTRPEETTPAPWVNVLANEGFGSVISESGAAYSWSENAHEFRLTPWNNDPVADTSGEALYLRDEESGKLCSPTMWPMRGPGQYQCRHGFGYSVFSHHELGIAMELTVFTALKDSVKIAILKIRNESGRPRRVSATGFAEWVLGEQRGKWAMHITTQLDPQTGAVFATNPYNSEFAHRVAFLDVYGPQRSATGDRTEFLGRNGSPEWPRGLERSRLSGRFGAALDPCAAIQVQLNLAENQEREVVVILGAGQDADDARRMIQRYRGGGARQALQEVKDYWEHTLSAVQVETPDPAVNALANGWLVYQTLGCRIWARSGFYQSGGAYGFRDQLQDSGALIHAQPQLVREHLLRAAARQFRQGDVQHWWHPPAGRGVRTHCSDDYLWLPAITCRYLQATGDHDVLEQIVPFLEGRPVQPDEEAYYDLPSQAAESGTLYEHCRRAVLHGLRMGQHGLPLMGGGDWNDGMNLVGAEGTGESVWLGFFLFDVLKQFKVVAQRRGDLEIVERCQREAELLCENIEKNAWDGEWYRRAYFDDGQPLGSKQNAECSIDAIAQSWSVLSQAAPPERAREAMQSANKHLVRRDAQLIQLLDPPFDKDPMNVGYIKGYVPGVRENGGQYTHAAVWTVMAFAALGDEARASELLKMINPVHHGATAKGIARYRIEPYVLAGDVYAAPDHLGRGGWSWYTGSAGWMYRLILESILGLQRFPDHLTFRPCLPIDWPSASVTYRFGGTRYQIDLKRVSAGANVVRTLVDGVESSTGEIALVDDEQEHRVTIELGTTEINRQQARMAGGSVD